MPTSDELIWIIAGYILGVVIAYGLSRTYMLKDDCVEDIVLSMCLGIAWPGFLLGSLVGSIVVVISWGIGKLLDIPVVWVKKLFKKR